MRALPLVLAWAFLDHAAASCSSDWVSYEGACYYFETSSKLEYSAAQAVCQSLDSRANLACVNSATENDWLASQAEDANDDITGFWIGYSDMADESTWVWEDSTCTSSYENWATNEPNGGASDDCVKLQVPETTWRDRPCTQTLPYVCKYEDSSSPTAGPTLFSTVSKLPSPHPTRVPLLSPSRPPSPAPIPAPTIKPSAQPTPSSKPSRRPSSKPSRRPTPRPTESPTVSAMPTLAPSIYRLVHATTSPTTSDTISIDAELVLTGSAAPTASDEDTVKTTIADTVNVDVSNIKNFAITYEAEQTRRRLLASTGRQLTSYSWTVSFTVVMSLGDADDDSVSSSSDFADLVNDRISEDLVPSLASAGVPVSGEVSVSVVDSSRSAADDGDDKGASSASSGSLLTTGFGAAAGTIILIAGAIVLYKKSKNWRRPGREPFFKLSFLKRVFGGESEVELTAVTLPAPVVASRLTVESGRAWSAPIAELRPQLDEELAEAVWVTSPSNNTSTSSTEQDFVVSTIHNGSTRISRTTTTASASAAQAQEGAARGTRTRRRGRRQAAMEEADEGRGSVTLDFLQIY
jgi:hypothetical protein